MSIDTKRPTGRFVLRRISLCTPLRKKILWRVMAGSTNDQHKKYLPTGLIFTVTLSFVIPHQKDL
jgi:hypothetical protein